MRGEAREFLPASSCREKARFCQPHSKSNHARKANLSGCNEALLIIRARGRGGRGGEAKKKRAR